MIDNKTIKSYSKGDILGLKSVLLDSSRTMNVSAKTLCVLYSISVESLRKVFGDNFRGQIYMIVIKIAFKNSCMLNKFDESLIDKSHPVFSIKNYYGNEVVVSAGSLMREKIIIVIEGSLYKVIHF
jgi:hypothetical protein